MGDEVRIFLLGKGVEIDSIRSEKFNVPEQVETYLKDNGRLYACGTCLQVRNLAPSKTYIVGTLKELYAIITESDKVVTF